MKKTTNEKEFEVDNNPIIGIKNKFENSLEKSNNM